MSEQLEALPNGWEISTLGEICEPSQYGYTAKAGASGNYKFLRTTDITKPDIDWENVPFCTIEDEDAKKYILSDGDIVISRAGSIGYSKLIKSPDKSVFASYLIRFRPLLNPKYLSYYLLTPDYWQAIGEGSSGIAVQNVNAKTLSAIQIPVAPENEQTRIVEKLEELLSDLDNGVAELQAAQKKLNQYRQSLLKSAVEGALTEQWREDNADSISESGEQLLARILKERRTRWEAQKEAEFKAKGKTPPKNWQEKYPEPVAPDTSELPELPEGWVWASVAQIASDAPYSLAIGPFGSNLKVSDYRESGVPLVFVRNIRSGNYGGEYTKFVSSEKAKELAAHSVSPGDVLVTKMGEPPGDADVFPKNQLDSIITADCIKVRCCESLILPDFLKATINSWIGKKQILPITKGVAQKKVSLGRFSGIAVPVPPFDEQKIIVDLLKQESDNIEAEFNATETALKQSEAQRKNILKDAFAGKLVPQDPTDEPASQLLDDIQKERAERAKQPKSKRPRNKAAAMKINIDTVRNWITKQDGSFTFEELSKANKTDYDSLQQIVFDLLDDKAAVIEQLFDEKQQQILFRKITK